MTRNKKEETNLMFKVNQCLKTDKIGDDVEIVDLIVNHVLSIVVNYRQPVYFCTICKYYVYYYAYFSHPRLL